MISWLDCETDTVPKNKCKIDDGNESEIQGLCFKFRAEIATRRNFGDELNSDNWIAGAETVRTSNIRDHTWPLRPACARNAAFKNLRACSGQGPLCAVWYAPIAQLLQGLAEEGETKLRKKFDMHVACLVATGSF